MSSKVVGLDKLPLQPIHLGIFHVPAHSIRSVIVHSNFVPRISEPIRERSQVRNFESYMIDARLRASFGTRTIRSTVKRHF